MHGPAAAHTRPRRGVREGKEGFERGQEEGLDYLVRVDSIGTNVLAK